MLNLFRPELSQNVRNWVQHGVNPTKCVQNNRHWCRGSLLVHNISFRPQNNKSAKKKHSPCQITPLVGLFGRSADLFSMPNFEYKHLSHHFMFTSKQSKMNDTPASGERQGCARLMNQRQHDSSYQPLAMDSSPQLPSGTNYTTSTIVPRSNRKHYRQNRTTAYQRHSRSWQAASRAPSSPLWRC